MMVATEEVFSDDHSQTGNQPGCQKCTIVLTKYLVDLVLKKPQMKHRISPNNYEENTLAEEGSIDFMM